MLKTVGFSGVLIGIRSRSMKTATAVTNADYLPIQGRSEPCQIIPFQSLGSFSIYCDGVLHATMQGTSAKARNRVVVLSNAHPEHDWEYE